MGFLYAKHEITSMFPYIFQCFQYKSWWITNPTGSPRAKISEKNVDTHDELRPTFRRIIFGGYASVLHVFNGAVFFRFRNDPLFFEQVGPQKVNFLTDVNFFHILLV